MAEYINREDFKEEYLCCGYLPEMSENEFDAFPASDVAPVRHGRWEVVKGVFTPGGDPLLMCPFCKAKESEHLYGVESRVDWNYCPNCGAKMDLED